MGCCSPFLGNDKSRQGCRHVFTGRVLCRLFFNPQIDKVNEFGEFLHHLSFHPCRIRTIEKGLHLTAGHFAGQIAARVSTKPVGYGK
jgi:hypothetical protein